jgi:hypothetical protein
MGENQRSPRKEVEIKWRETKGWWWRRINKGGLGRGGGEASVENFLSAPCEIDEIRFVPGLLFNRYKCCHICTGWVRGGPDGPL